MEPFDQELLLAPGFNDTYINALLYSFVSLLGIDTESGMIRELLISYLESVENILKVNDSTLKDFFTNFFDKHKEEWGLSSSQFKIFLEANF